MKTKTPKAKMNKAHRYWGIVPAAGKSERTASKAPKQYIKIHGKYVLDHSIQALLQCHKIEAITVVIAKGDDHWQTTDAAHHPRVNACHGGEHRFESVHNALTELAGKAADDDWIVVHDGARPCLSESDLTHLLETIKEEPAGGIATIRITDTVKQVSDGYIAQTLDRETLYRAATPQVFRYRILCEAYANARQAGDVPSDEASAVERIQQPIRAVVCSNSNIKITYPEDIVHATALLDP